MQNKIKELTTQRDSINNEHRRAVDKMLEIKKEKKLYEELKKEVEKYDFNGFDKDGVHKILVNIMILMVLIAMVLMWIPMINIIVKVLI